MKLPEGENMELTIKDTKDAFREIFKKKEKVSLNIISENMTLNNQQLSQSSEQVASINQQFRQFENSLGIYLKVAKRSAQSLKLKLGKEKQN